MPQPVTYLFKSPTKQNELILRHPGPPAGDARFEGAATASPVHSPVQAK